MGSSTSCEFKKTTKDLNKILISDTDNLLEGQSKFICTEYQHTNPKKISDKENWITENEKTIFFDLF